MTRFTFDQYMEPDDVGPSKTLYLAEQRTGLRAMVVVDNVAAGPAIGGVRMASDATPEDCTRLARAMTLKNALAGLGHGGAKAVIFADPKMDPGAKEALVRAFASAIARLEEYVPGPDMGTDESCMAWIFDEIGRAVGLPAELGGLPLDELGATGHGLAAAARVVAEHVDLDLDGARVVIQGYGSVGRHAARFLAEIGTVLVGVSDSRGAAVDGSGLDLDELDHLKDDGRSVAEYGTGAIDPEDLVAVSCDIWIPAATPDALRVDNIDRLDAKVVLQGANIAATVEAEQHMHERGVVSVPDIVANAGGVICAAVESTNGTRELAFDTIRERISANTAAVLERSEALRVTPRRAALDVARQRLERAMSGRRWN